MTALLALIGLAAASEPEAAFPSSPPIGIDDAETVEAGHVEVNLTAGWSGRAEGWESEAPLVDGNLGLSDNVHINAEIPLVIQGGAGGLSAALGNAAVACKVRILHRPGLQLAIHPALDLPSFHQEPGATGEPLVLTLPAVVDAALGSGGLGLGAQLAHTWAPSTGEHGWGAALGLAHPLGETGVLMGDLTLETDGRLSPGEAWGELGYVREGLFGREGLTLLSSAGLSVGGEAEALLGVQLAR